MRVETITYQGHKFRRYPESKHRTDRVYFTPGHADKANGIRRLHEEIWQDTHGQRIPQGHDIHHADRNPLNNDPENLVLLSHAEHMREHAKDPISDSKRQHLERVRPLAAAWHSSDDGRAWHRRHGVEVAAKRSVKSCVCEQCGADYTTVAQAPGRFCSNRCKSAARRASGVDNEQRTCAKCGTTFTVSRYAKQVNCSRRCGASAYTVRVP